MKRRQFIQAAGAGIAAVAIAKPAVAQSMPELKWRLTSSFPKSLDTLFGAAEIFSKAVAEATDNRFQIEVLAAGEVAPALQALDAVSDGKVEICHTASSYYFGKDPTFAIGTAIPFGMNQRMLEAWMFYGGGTELLNDFYKKFDVIGFPAGNTGAQMGGWFRKEIKTTRDLKDLKMRIGGLGGKVLAKLGAVPQQVAGGDIYAALEKGTLDATEWVGPYDDVKLGFHKVAKYYYYPGWWEGSSMLHNFVNLSKWNELPDTYKSIIQSASHVANTLMRAKYDAQNPAALKRLVVGGAQLRPFSQQVLEASYKAANEVFAEISESNAAFKKIHDAYRAFGSNEYLWWQVAEYTFDTFMIQARRRS